MKENKLLQKLRFNYQIFLTSFTSNIIIFLLQSKFMLRKYFTKETHKKVKLLIKTNAMSPTDFNPLHI